jgi:hypothetical protein
MYMAKTFLPYPPPPKKNNPKKTTTKKKPQKHAHQVNCSVKNA